MQEQDGQSIHALAQVRPGRLAGLLPRRRQIQDVVGDLEGDTHLLTEVGHDIGDQAPRARQERPEGRRRRHEGTRLVGQDLQVEVDAIGPMCRTEGLVQLPLAQALEGARVVGNDLGTQGGNQQGGAREKNVTREDCSVVAPQVLSRGNPAPRRRGIHDIVVVEGRQVGELDGGRRRQHRVVQAAIALPQLRAHEGQERTHPLATRDRQV